MVATVSWRPEGDSVTLTDMAVRSPEKRKADALLKLEAAESKVGSGPPCRPVMITPVPVTRTWNCNQVVLAIRPDDASGISTSIHSSIAARDIRPPSPSRRRGAPLATVLPASYCGAVDRGNSRTP
jgi:hypothetical protein